MNTVKTEIDPREENVQEVTGEVTALELLNKSEIDQQITTAHKFPRSLRRFMVEGQEMACLSKEVAAECTYALPRGDKFITGPSARFAEIVASAWGNCRAGARTIGEEGDHVVAQGGFHDLERNVHITFEVRRRIVDKHGNRFNADMIGMTANAACSIALRNAVLKGIPKAYWNQIWMKSKGTAAGDAQSLELARDAAMKAFKNIGVSPENVCERLGVEGIADIGIDELVILQGLLNSINEGETEVKTAFPYAAEPTRKTRAPRAEKEKPVTPTKPEPPAGEKVLNDTEMNLIRAVAKRRNINDDDLAVIIHDTYKCTLAQLPASKLDEALKLIQTQK